MREHLKIAVYAVALNEEKFVDRFMDSCEGANYVVVADTGSSDRTVPKLQERGAIVMPIAVMPFRFDVARNTALSLVPRNVDICISLDLDEVLLPGWREALEFACTPFTSTRFRYDYVWNFDADGRPGLQYMQDKCHARHGYVWQHPCHENLRYMLGTETVVDVPDMHIHHHADLTKPRGQYLPLLEMAVQERPHDDRAVFYYGRELFFQGKPQAAAAVLTRYLELPSATWKEERAQAMIYIAEAIKEPDPDAALLWLTRATMESDRREPLLALAREHYRKERWAECYAACQRILAITERSTVYYNEPDAWGSVPYDLAAISAYHMGLHEKACEYGEIAATMDLSDQRLQANLSFYRNQP